MANKLTNDIVHNYIKRNINDKIDTILNFYTDTDDTALLVIEYTVFNQNNPHRTKIKLSLIV